MNKILTLCYHDLKNDKLLNSGFGSKGSNMYTIDDNIFRSQISFLNANDVILVDKLNKNCRKNKIILTFDDAGLSAYNIAIPALEELNLKAHFFIPTNYIGMKNFLNKQQIRDISELGHKIGTHSTSHPDRISSLSIDKQYHEWQSSIDTLEDIIGKKINCASIPNGDTSYSVYDCMNNLGINYIFNSYPSLKVRNFRNSFIFGRVAIKKSHNLKIVKSIMKGNIKFILFFKLLSLLKIGAKKLLGSNYLILRRYLFNF
tara:strand:+ start:191 stop:967 length:777 start_codon:yes stop_codon:yes gene_type:complete